MPFRLLRFALNSRYPEPRMFRTPERLRTSYDVVIIGAGGHGLAAAYYLARDHGISNVAVLEKGYIGGGNTCHNTTKVRACGKQNVHHFEREDLVALTVEAAAMARVPLAGTNWIPGTTSI